MRVLLAHRFLPGHFGPLARALLAAGHEVVFLHQEPGEAPAGARCIKIQPSRGPAPQTHPYLQSSERAVLLGQAAYRAAHALREAGFQPEVLVAHSGFGIGLYLKDAFPRVPLLGLFEWFYRAHGSDADFLPEMRPELDDVLRIRTQNASILIELDAVDHGIVPTRFQRSQFPAAAQAKLEVLHDGVDTRFFHPLPARPDPSRLRCAGLPQRVPLVTYATRGLEPYRGFGPFLGALEIVQRERPDVHAVVAGKDASFYGREPPPGTSWAQLALDAHPGLDRSRLHLVGVLEREDYRCLLRSSCAHVYLTVPFVLSWSILEAMACAAPVVASATPPVEEVAVHGREALLAPFGGTEAIAEAILTLLERPQLGAELGAAARARVVRDYAHETLLPRHLDLLDRLRLSAAHLAAVISSGSRTSRRSIDGLQSLLVSSVR